MVQKMFLNGSLIYLRNYEEEKIDGLYKVSVDFNVTSEEYHDITTLLYNGTFDVEIPERDLIFKGRIQNYSTSITNLYEKNQTGQFQLSLMEVNHEAKD